MVSIAGGVGRFVPMAMVVDTEDDTTAWYWKGLPTRTLAFQRQKCAPSHKSFKEHLMTICYGNKPRNHKMKLVVTGQPKNHSCSRAPK
jgi:hypothetical protein